MSKNSITIRLIRFYLIGCFLFLPTLIVPCFSQTGCQNFNCVINKVRNNIKQRQYPQALDNLESAAAYPNSQSETIRKLRAQLFDQILVERRAALRDRNRARLAELRADSLRQAAEEALAIANSERAKNERIINQLYFYKGKFALAHNGHYYGFIDKEGQAHIPFKYTQAKPFNYQGYAEVEASSKKYLIDTLGEEFLLATKVNQLSSKTKAADLSGQGLKEFPEELLAVEGLVYLNLSSNQISHLPDSISNLSKLRYLDLSFNNIKQLPYSITTLNKLKVLLASHNKFHKIPNKIGDLESLIRVDFAMNNIREVPESIGQLRKLEILKLDNNKIVKIPGSFKKLKSLTRIDLNFNQLDHFPLSFLDLISLKKLDLTANKLTVLPAEIANLKQLESLSLSFNRMSKLPESLSELKNLKSVLLGNNAFQTFPLVITKIPNLQSLSLENIFTPKRKNGFTNLETKLGAFQEFMLSHFPPDRQPTQVWAVIQSGFSQNRINELPLEIIQLTDLKRLYLDNIQLRKVPNEIGTLKKLTYLDLSRNNLETLPSSLGSLVKLKNILLNENPLPSEEIERLRYLLPSCKINFSTKSRYD